MNSELWSTRVTRKLVDELRIRKWMTTLGRDAVYTAAFSKTLCPWTKISRFKGYNLTPTPGQPYLLCLIFMELECRTVNTTEGTPSHWTLSYRHPTAQQSKVLSLQIRPQIFGNVKLFGTPVGTLSHLDSSGCNLSHFAWIGGKHYGEHCAIIFGCDFCFVSFLDVFLILFELSSLQGTRVPAASVYPWFHSHSK